MALEPGFFDRPPLRRARVRCERGSVWWALEVTGNAWEIARILQRHVRRVIVVNPSDTGIAQARAKTDRLDARALAKLLAIGELDAAGCPTSARR